MGAEGMSAGVGVACATLIEEQKSKRALWEVWEANDMRLDRPRSCGSKADSGIAKFTDQAQWIMWVVSDCKDW